MLRRVLARLARVRLVAPDPAEVGARYAALLGRRPEGGVPEGAPRFRLENVTLAIEAGDAPGLAGLVFAATDLARFREAAEAAGLEPARPEGRPPAVALGRAATRGVPLSVVEEGEADLAALGAPPAADAVRALDHVVIRVGEPEASRRLYGERLGLRLALDRSFPEWGVRLLFFRVGGLTVELAASLGEGGGKGGGTGIGAREGPLAEAADRLWGLSWRVDDVDAARARLARAGLDVSPARAGRKPGTRVVTVRDGTSGVPTLLLGPDRAVAA